jgi:hypothetical protein
MMKEDSDARLRGSSALRADADAPCQGLGMFDVKAFGSAAYCTGPGLRV